MSTITSPDVTGKIRAFVTDWFARLEAIGFDGGVYPGRPRRGPRLDRDGELASLGHVPRQTGYIEGIWRRLDERLERWPRAQVLRILADGEWATIDFHGIGGLGRNGTDYTLDYCWVMRVADGLVREVIGNYDQMKIAELFEPA